ncbi:MAG: hypothetical protein ACO331_10060, partial [Prochlorothrix sp.]
MLHSAVGVETMPDSLTRETIGQTVLRLRDEPVVHKQPEAWVPTPTVITAMEQLIELVAEVRSPEGGWPADRSPTAENLTPYVLDEAYDLLVALQQSHQPEQQAPWQPFHALQQLLQRRLLVVDAIPHLLWTIARSSPQAMKLLAGMRAEIFQPGQTWERGVLRLVALLELRTPHLHWTLDLATLEPPPPELQTNTLVRWSDNKIHWVEGFLQGLHNQLQEETPLVKPLLQTPTAVEVLVPGQSWETGFLQLQLQLTFSADTLYLPVVPLSPALGQPTVLEAIVKCIEGSSWDSRGTRSLQAGADRGAEPQESGPNDAPQSFSKATSATPQTGSQSSSPVAPQSSQSSSPAPAVSPVAPQSSPQSSTQFGSQFPSRSGSQSGSQSSPQAGSQFRSASQSSPQTGSQSSPQSSPVKVESSIAAQTAGTEADSVDFTLNLPFPTPQRAIAAVLAPPVSTVEAEDLGADELAAEIGEALETKPAIDPAIDTAIGSALEVAIDPALATGPPTALSLFGELGEPLADQLGGQLANPVGRQPRDRSPAQPTQPNAPLQTQSQTQSQTQPQIQPQTQPPTQIGDRSRDLTQQNPTSDRAGNAVTTKNSELASLTVDRFGDLFDDIPAWDAPIEAAIIETQALNPAAKVEPAIDPVADTALSSPGDAGSKLIDPGVLSYPTATNFLDFLPSLFDSPTPQPETPPSATPANSAPTPPAPTPPAPNPAAPDRSPSPGPDPEDDPESLTLAQAADLFPSWQEEPARDPALTEVSAPSEDFLADLIASPDLFGSDASDPETIAAPIAETIAEAATVAAPIAEAIAETGAAPIAETIAETLAEPVTGAVLEVVPVDADTRDLADFLQATGVTSLEDMHLD